MAHPYDLTKLDPSAFEHLILALAIEVLGPGATNFSPGPDGGRDVVFEGEADYPSTKDRWAGTWYMQCKYHRPHLSKNSQTWLIEQIKSEIELFEQPGNDREWPDNWIIATNIDPSGKARTGAYDKARELIKKAHPKMNFDIWGGSRLLAYLKRYPFIADQYAEFITPGDVLAKIRDVLGDLYADVGNIVNHVVVSQFSEQIYTKLEQAGSSSDSRPGVHKLFVDLPFALPNRDVHGYVGETLFFAASRNHRPSARVGTNGHCMKWNQHPLHARALVLKGGPGQGKSTLGQYVAQVHRAAFILGRNPAAPPKTYELAKEIKLFAEKRGHWPAVPRIPLLLELKDFAQWFGARTKDEPRGFLTYVSERLSRSFEVKVLPATYRRALGSNKWFFIFDGLDEVPNDVKNAVGNEIRHFLDEVVAETDADLLALCTSRPQGYSGQFDELDGPVADLIPLAPHIALECCRPLIEMDRPPHEAERLMQTLTVAIDSAGVKELMTTPLQSHIMAVVVRDGGRPPERRWQLFSNFYQVMKKREVLKGFPNPAIARLLSERDKLLKALHSALGFMLHSRAERSDGAQTQLSRAEFKKLVALIVAELADDDIDETVETLMEATVERLVFVNTPDNAEHVRFDIRQLQEFFAAEYIYEGITASSLQKCLSIIIGDAHWREVMHFMFSALIENGRATELAVAISELEQLDRSEDGETRAINVRMARGALLAARLLVEGVFEQDKKIRGQFRNALTPILGLLENSYFVSLANMREGMSKNWLINFALEALKIYSPSENIGAAIYLTKVLKSSDDRSVSVARHLRESKLEYRNFVISTFSSFIDHRKRESETTAEDWIMQYCLAEMIGEDWWHLSRSARATLLVLMQGGQARTFELAASIMSQAEVKLLKALIAPFEDDKGSEVDFGIVTGVLTRYDWVTGVLPAGIWSASSPDGVAEARGALSLVKKILSYAQFRSKAALSELIDFLSDKGDAALDGLPLHLSVLLPSGDAGGFQTQFQALKAIRDLPDAQFETVISRRKPRASRLSRPAVTWYISRGRYDQSKMVELARFSPRTALDVITDNAFFNLPTSITLGDEFAEHLLRSPLAIVRYLLQFGRLFELMPKYEEKFRLAAVESTKLILSIDDWRVNYIRKLYPFEIDIKTEVALLPLLVAIFGKQRVFIEGEKSYREMLAQFVKYVPDVTALQGLLEDAMAPTKQRASALLCLLMHAASSEQGLPTITALLAQYKEYIAEFTALQDVAWFFNAMSQICMFLPADCSVCLEPLVANLLDRTAERFTERALLQRLLDVWRERSAGPVHAAGLPELKSLLPMTT